MPPSLSTPYVILHTQTHGENKQHCSRALPAGWSAITQFKPIIRKPVIQAKPKLHKPTSAPASLTGPPATSLSHQIVYSAPPTASQHDAAPTGQGPGKSFGGKLVSEDVNGFKAINNLKEKKKNKGKNKQGQNQPLPQPSMDEDYDPFRPNDYEIYKATEKKRKEELAAERETQRRHIYRSNSRSKSRSRSRSGSRSQSRSKSRSRTPEERDYRRHINQFAPPPTLYERDTSSPYEEDVFMQATTPPPPPQLLPAVSPAAGPAQVVNLGESADEAWMRRARMSGKPVVLEPKRSPEPERMGLGLGGGGSGQDVARRLMSKYGWQEGQGLGKSEDGIREALQVQQTGRGAGVIVNTSASPSFVAASPPSRVPLNPVVPTKVILLTNMVGPGDVDELLQEETADECSKYGKVELFLYYPLYSHSVPLLSVQNHILSAQLLQYLQVSNGMLPDSESVRIFVKFESEASAGRAIADLNGRFFGGRVVNARFFPEDRFEKLNLAPSAAEMQSLKGVA
ncbi:hypothetical protein BC938DRAFT_472357 [Jimgerdemannia flammicorona]|uniref:G-patch domain-containing protein n=1 Tax=Jimgerdemannia flammicorona TaxID=994334 RepID=A0A433Q697_9FUNG|nr:hypothetical protein BC938DRAFT_472357 [Jimgerdemannia flammicorona]